MGTSLSPNSLKLRLIVCAIAYERAAVAVVGEATRAVCMVGKATERSNGMPNRMYVGGSSAGVTVTVNVSVRL